jgi:hypothetical protein
MRKALERREDERATFTGTFERYGAKTGWQGRQEKTLLLKDIMDSRGAKVCDHLWFNLTVDFAKLRLQPGDMVQFDARVKSYWKGYEGRREDVDKPVERDYKLSHPTRVVRLSSAAQPAGITETTEVAATEQTAPPTEPRPYWQDELSSA